MHSFVAKKIRIREPGKGGWGSPFWNLLLEKYDQAVAVATHLKAWHAQVRLPTLPTLMSRSYCCHSQVWLPRLASPRSSGLACASQIQGEAERVRN